MGKKAKRPKARALEGQSGKRPKVDPTVRENRTPMGQRVTFAFNLVDDEAEAFPYHHGAEAGPQLLHFLKETSRLTWAQALDFRVEGRAKNHFQEIETLSPLAQRRLDERNLTNIVGEDLFRFRLDGPGRVWGFVAEGTFFPIWWDEHHQVYPSPKR